MIAQAVRLSVALTVLFFASLAGTPAGATFMCGVKQTSDGFVALREKPSGTAKLVARLTAKDTVLVPHDHDPVGHWIFVEKLNRDGSYGGASGWVLDRLISNGDCG